MATPGNGTKYPVTALHPSGSRLTKPGDRSYPSYRCDAALGDSQAECLPVQFPSSRTRRRRHRRRMQRLRTFSFNMHQTFSGLKISGRKTRSRSFDSSDSGGEDGDMNSMESYDSGNASACERVQIIQQQKKLQKKHLRQPLEGQLYKYTNVVKGWQYRWFVLEPDSGRLDYFEREEHKLQKARGSLYLSGAVIAPSDEDSQTFTVNAANGEIYRLRAIDAKERQHWVNRLRATAEHHSDALAQNLLPFMKDNRIPSVGAHQQLSRNNSGSLDSLSGNRGGCETKQKASTLPNMTSSKESPRASSPPPPSPCSAPDIKKSLLNHVTGTNGLNNNNGVAVLKRNSSLPVTNAANRARSHVTPKGLTERSSVVVLKRSQHKHIGTHAHHTSNPAGQCPAAPGSYMVAPPSPTQVITASQSEDCFRNVQDMLSSIHYQQQAVVEHIEELPNSGESIHSFDKDMLLLKATSGATLACLEQCLSILQQQQVAASQNPSLAYSTSVEWVDPKPLQLTLPVPTSRLMSDPVSPADSYVSASSLVCDNRKSPPPSSSHQLQDNTDSPRSDDPEDVEDPEEYTDTELGTVEEHKSIILHLLSQLKLGMDLTKVVLPTFILEKRSLLELFADCMAHPDIFIGIPDLPTPEARMLGVLEWFLTSFHAGKKGSIAKKPYNPIIGETFHCSWEVPPPPHPSQSQPCSQCHESEKPSSQSLPNGKPESEETLLSVGEGQGQLDIGAQGDQHSNVQGQSSNGKDSCRTASGTRLVYCAEQVSHHPPVSAFYFECPEKAVCMNASIWTKSKFMGMSIGVVMVGKLHLKLVDLDEEYEFSLPSAYARSILTIPWMELGDKIQITCQKTGHSASVTFHTKPFYGGKLHKVSTEVKNTSGDVICKGSGEWNGSMELSHTNGTTKVLDTTKMKALRKCVRPLNQQAEFESRRLWKNVTDSLKKGEIDTATQHKRFLEERQRQGERHRKETNTPFPTKYFHKEGDSWVFNKVLKSKCPSS